MEGGHDAMEIEDGDEYDTDVAHQYVARQFWIADTDSDDVRNEKDDEGCRRQSERPVGRLLYVVEEKKNDETHQRKGRNEAKDIVDDEMDIIRHCGP
jgi:hypothetical protein